MEPSSNIQPPTFQNLCIKLPQEIAEQEIEQEQKRITDHFFNQGKLQGDVIYISPKRSYADLTAMTPPPLTSIYTKTLIIDPSDPRKRIRSTIKIARSPYLQATKKDYSAFPDIVTKPFGNWTIEEQTIAVNKLRRWDIPLQDDHIYKIYAILKEHETLLCHNEDISYPALYAVTGSYDKYDQEEGFVNPPKENSFDLEIHSTNKATLIFRNVEKTFIGHGASKEAWKTFALGTAELRAHTFSLPHPQTTTYADQEEKGFSEFQGKSWIATAYNIYYYHMVIEQECHEQQVIEMQFYPYDLHTIITTYSISTHTRLAYSIQIMEAIKDMHEKEFIYRDFKPDNFLVRENFNLALTDFGLSCNVLSDRLRNEAGTPSFMAPEILLKKKESYSYSLDIWSAGCLLYILLIGKPFPWYVDTLFNEKTNKKPDFNKVLKKMTKFDNESVNPNDTNDPNIPIKFLIWNMLRFDPVNRWDATTVLDYLKNFQESMQRKIA